MELQARIAAALTDFDDLLLQGVSIEVALEVAAVENNVSIEVLSSRASRLTTLEERQRQVIEKFELAKKAAEIYKNEASGNRLAVALETERRKVIADLRADLAKQEADRANHTEQSMTGHTAPKNEEPKRQSGMRGQLKFDY